MRSSAAFVVPHGFGESQPGVARVINAGCWAGDRAAVAGSSGSSPGGSWIARCNRVQPYAIGDCLIDDRNNTVT